MSEVYQAKLVDAIETRLLNYCGGLSVGPLDDFVVTLSRDGSAASKFGDLVWDFTAYTKDRTQLRFYFDYWDEGDATPSRIARSRCARRIVFVLIWARAGAPLSLGTLSNYITVLNECARYAEEVGASLEEFLSDGDMVTKYAATNASGWMCETLGSLLGGLRHNSSEVLGFSIASPKAVDVVKAYGRQYRSRIKQHYPMPTRIYSGFLTNLQHELANWVEISKETLALFARCASDSFYGRSVEQQRHQIAKKLGVSSKGFKSQPEFLDVCPPSLEDYMHTRGFALNVKGLSRIVTEIQWVCKLTIQSFTGMRDDEAGALQYHCLDVSVMNGRAHYLVNGRTTKFNHGLPKAAKWVTNEEGKKAIEIAQKIADTIYAVHGALPERGDPRKSVHPLFPSTSYMNLAGGIVGASDEYFVKGGLCFPARSRLPERLFPTIEEGDLTELENIDPHRAWRAEAPFKIGTRWDFKSHQLRRSLALYAQRSGLVSLPSLRRQLHHLTEEMSRYYARGSVYAANLIGEEKGHFGREWQQTQLESSALGYILNVLQTEDVLIGGHASWIQRHAKGRDEKVLLDRATTMHRFKKGEMAFRETVLGGCTSTEGCNQIAITWLNIECLSNNCKNLVCNSSKLERVVIAQERLVANITPDSVEHRTELADLQVLRDAMAIVALKKQETRA